MCVIQKANFPGIKHAATYFLKIVLLAVVYHLAARLGLKMAYVQINTSPVWPPTGIALAALLLFGYNLWPGISLGVFLGSLLNGAQFDLALGMALGNTLEAIFGAFCLKRFVGFHNAIDRVRDVIGLISFSIISTTIGATLGTLALMLTVLGERQSFPTIWLTWWIGDLLGALVVAPVLLVWMARSPFQTRWRAAVEGGVLLIWLTLVTGYVFGNQPPASIFHQALIYVIFPFMIWAALRLGQRGATLAILLVSGIAIGGTVQGAGPFSLESRNDSLVLLQTFMAVVSLTTLILAAATIERRTATEALHQRVEDLATLNDSSRTFLDNSDSDSMYRTICELTVTRLGLDVAWIETPDHEHRDPCLAAAYGLSRDAIVILKAVWEGQAIQTFDHACVKTIDDWRPSPVSTGAAYRSYAAFPLVFGGRAIGVLKLLSTSHSFFSEDRQLLIQSYANLAAAALQNNWLFEEVRHTNKQLHALSQRLMKAQEEERLHLSRELHDESGQLLSALRVQLGLLERDADHPSSVNEGITELKRTAKALQDDLHRLAVDLRPASLDHLGLVMALQQYIGEFSRQYNIDVQFETVGMQDKRLPSEVETALFRIVQESLTNVALHAQATRVDIVINWRNNHVATIIEDNGVGFVLAASIAESHLGLFGMRERVEMLGGQLTVESSPGKGTTVTVEVPCDA